MRRYASSAIWSLMAALSVSAAVAAALGDNGRDRIALLLDGPPSGVAKSDPGADISRLHADIARLRSETRLLNLEKQALATKLDEMESRVGPTTASLPPRAEPLDEAERDVVADVARFAHPEARSETRRTRTRFALEVGTGTALDALRARWERLLARNGSLVEGLEPSVALDARDDGVVGLRLLAGAYDDFADAIAACVALEAEAVPCNPVPLEGQTLVMR